MKKDELNARKVKIVNIDYDKPKEVKLINYGENNMTNEKITIKSELATLAEYLTGTNKADAKKHILRDIELALVKEQLEQNAIKIIDRKGNLCCSRETFMAFLGNILNNDQVF